ncbi:hypothetical protein KDD30_16070 [Photobacterium sp. GJ3]|uniref:hypothetical protein n=1 Tax=Photobacterium sp. GJ3 TaxID=2829502 RepID=UPI001B8D1AB1|nr:hypothetical protein [Photobacterium sp. GJ3]QUJ67517.1 hypothetical protein KDD30_16070 [Photobacterium sp. GJ3]
MKDHPFSIAAGRTKFHRLLRIIVVNIVIAIDVALITLMKHIIPNLLGVDIHEPIRAMDNQWLPLSLIALIGVIFILLFYFSMRACDWLCKQLRI